MSIATDPVAILEAAVLDLGKASPLSGQLGVRLPQSAHDALDFIAAEGGPGVNKPDVVRAAIHLLLQRRLRELRTTAKADAIAAQARRLFAELPEDELSEDEAIAFNMNEGVLAVRLERTGALYRMYEGMAVRVVDDELTLFDGGAEIERRRIGQDASVDLAAAAATASPAEMKRLIDEALG